MGKQEDTNEVEIVSRRECFFASRFFFLSGGYAVWKKYVGIVVVSQQRRCTKAKVDIGAKVGKRRL